MFPKLTLLATALALVAVAAADLANKNAKAFNELNEYLLKSLKDNQDLQANLEAAQAKLSDGSLKGAIEALNTLASNLERCNYEVIAAIDYINHAGLNPAEGENRVEAMARHLVSAARGSCDLFIESELNKLKSELPEFARKSSEKQRFESIEGSSGYPNPYFMEEYGKLAYSDMVKLAAADTNGSFQEMKVDEENGMLVKDEEAIRSAFNKYIIEPCEQYTSSSYPLFDAISVLLNYLSANYGAPSRFLSERADEILIGIYRCKAVVALSPAQIVNL